MSMTWGTANLEKDAKAIEEAKQQLNWAGLTPEQRAKATSALVQLAQRIKMAL